MGSTDAAAARSLHISPGIALGMKVEGLWFRVRGLVLRI
jgi:hypothetical protein